MKGWTEYNAKGNTGGTGLGKDGQETYMTGTGTPVTKGLHRQARRWDRIKKEWEVTLGTPIIRTEQGQGRRNRMSTGQDLGHQAIKNSTDEQGYIIGWGMNRRGHKEH